MMYLIGATIGAAFVLVFLAAWDLQLGVPFAVGVTGLCIVGEIRRTFKR